MKVTAKQVEQVLIDCQAMAESLIDTAEKMQQALATERVRVGQLAMLLRDERCYASINASCQVGIVERCRCRICRIRRIDAALSELPK